MSEPKVGFSALEDLPIAIDRADIERAYQPFLAEFDAAAFEGDVARRKRKAFIRLIKHKLGLKPRDTDAIKAEYHEAWSARHARYDVSRGAERPAAWVWGDKKLWIDTIAAARMRAPMLAAVIRALNAPKEDRVLRATATGYLHGDNCAIRHMDLVTFLSVESLRLSGDSRPNGC